MHDGNLQIDNNLVENAIRPIALGRKNYLFAGSHEAAQRSAMIYSFFAICKKHEVNPFQWIKHTLENIMSINHKNLKDLYPQNFKNNLQKLNMFSRLSTMEFIVRKENIIVCGASGVGKSYLAQALGHQACLNGHRTMYVITSRIFKKLKLSKVDGTYLKELEKLVKPELLILDDFGLQAFDNNDRETLMDIIDDRHSKKSTIIASQIPVSAWYEIIGGEGTLADAILDRIVNSSHRLDLMGESLRKGALKNE